MPGQNSSDQFLTINRVIRFAIAVRTLFANTYIELFRNSKFFQSSYGIRHISGYLVGSALTALIFGRIEVLLFGVVLHCLFDPDLQPFYHPIVKNHWAKFTFALFGLTVVRPLNGLNCFLGFAIGLFIGTLFDVITTLVADYEEGNLDLGQATASQHTFAKTALPLFALLTREDGALTDSQFSVVDKYVSDVIGKGKIDREQIERFLAYSQSSTRSFQARAESFHYYFRKDLALQKSLLEALVQFLFTEGLAVEHKLLIESAARTFGLHGQPLDRIYARCQMAKTISEAKPTEGPETPAEEAPPDYSVCYRMLGLTESASNQAIRESYRKIMKEVHPDRVNTLELSRDVREQTNEKFLLAQEAYEVLRKVRKF